MKSRDDDIIIGVFQVADIRCINLNVFFIFSDTTLVFTPSLVHAWESAGEIRVSIRAYARGEEIDRWDLKPLRGGAPKAKP